MDSFYEIMELLYKFNKKYPEISYGCLMHNLSLKDERFFYLSNQEIIKRMKIILEEDE